MIGKLNQNFLHKQSEPPHSVFHLIYFTFIFYYVHVCLACLSITALSKCSIWETRRGCWIPWNWRCELPCGYCKVNQVAMTPEQRLCLLCLYPRVSDFLYWEFIQCMGCWQARPRLPKLGRASICFLEVLIQWSRQSPIDILKKKTFNKRYISSFALINLRTSPCP